MRWNLPNAAKVGARLLTVLSALAAACGAETAGPLGSTLRDAPDST